MNGIVFSEIATTLYSKPGAIFTIVRDSGGMIPNVRKCAVSHLTLSEREEIRVGSLLKKVSELLRNQSIVRLLLSQEKFNITVADAITKRWLRTTGRTEWPKGLSAVWWR